MLISDVSVKRPVFATVISLLLVAFGLISFDRLPLREYPDIDPPVVSIETAYPGASAAVVETKITQLIEDRVSGIEGIRTISSESRDGQSDITIEFTLDRDIDAAANDVRERLSRVVDNLPEEADPPEIFKVDSNQSVIMWLNLSSPVLNRLELTDYADRYLVDRFSVLPGVARVRIGGQQRYAMRIWLDREAMAARDITVADVETALREQNVELPAGRLESIQREFTVRTERLYNNADDFRALVVRRGDDGHLVRLGEVARVERQAADLRNELRGNGEDMVGLGIIRQSTANTLAVAQAVKAEAERVRESLPEAIELHQSYDTSVFIQEAIDEVYKTLGIATVLVVLVIYLFLGNARAMLVPAVTVPVSLVATSIVLYALGFSINLLTLLALVLAIGLVVDDAIVMLENIHRRIEQGEPPLLAAFRGARQVGFAIIATTLVLISVFVPIAFLQGSTGRLFTEFALAIAAAVAFSSLVALTLSPVMCSKFLKPHDQPAGFYGWLERGFDRLTAVYRRSLEAVLRRPWWSGLVLLAVLGVVVVLLRVVPSEFTPREDRGAFFVIVTAPEGTSYDRTVNYMREIEARMMPMIESGEATRVLARVPGSFGSTEVVNTARGIVVLAPFGERRSGFEIMNELSQSFAEVPGVKAFPVMRRGIGGRGISQAVEFVIGGPSYETLAEWRDIILERAAENPGLVSLDSDYKETKPQLQVTIDKTRAADLGVSVESIGRTLETMLGSRRVTTYLDRGEEYDVIVEGEESLHRTPQDLTNIYVRSATTGELIPLASLVSYAESAASTTLNRYNRIRAITISANLADGYTLGEAITFLEEVVRDELPPTAKVDYKGQSLELKESAQSVLFVFGLALLVAYLVMAAQFESFVHPFVIMLTVPLAVAGGLFGLYLTGQSLNIYSQIGMVMLIGLAAKNGILIVEFANQLRDAGHAFHEALVEAATLRLRPILMTAITTVMGAVPLILATGAGSESRVVIGVVVFAGVLFATFFTLFIIPAAYSILSRHAGSPEDTAHALDKLRQETEHRV
jgi:multidrug efflux pump